MSFVIRSVHSMHFVNGNTTATFFPYILIFYAQLFDIDKV